MEVFVPDIRYSKNFEFLHTLIWTDITSCTKMTLEKAALGGGCQKVTSCIGVALLNDVHCTYYNSQTDLPCEKMTKEQLKSLKCNKTDIVQLSLVGS